ncbi:MAG: hypothetical protein ABI743_06365 [bacterium]
MLPWNPMSDYEPRPIRSVELPIDEPVTPSRWLRLRPALLGAAALAVLGIALIAVQTPKRHKLPPIPRDAYIEDLPQAIQQNKTEPIAVAKLPQKRTAPESINKKAPNKPATPHPDPPTPGPVGVEQPADAPPPVETTPAAVPVVPPSPQIALPTSDETPETTAPIVEEHPSIMPAVPAASPTPPPVQQPEPAKTDPEPHQAETPVVAAVPAPGPAPAPKPNTLPTTDFFNLGQGTGHGNAVNPDPSGDGPHGSPAPRALPSNDGPPLHAFNANEQQVWAVDISPDGTTIATGGKDEHAALWNLNAGTAAGQLAATDDHTNWIVAVSYSSDGRFVATGSEDGTVKLWDLATGRNLVKTIHTPGDSLAVRTLAFDPSSNRLFIGYDDARGTIRIFDPAGWKERATTLKHGGAMRALAVSPDGKLLVTGGDDNAAHLWNIATGALVADLGGHRGWVQAVAFNAHGEVATGSSDGSLRVWSTAGKLVETIANANKGGVYALAFRKSDGRLLASGGADGVVRLWDALDGSTKGEFPGHIGIVTSLVFTQAGTRLVTATLQDAYDNRTVPNVRVYAVK